MQFNWTTTEEVRKKLQNYEGRIFSDDEIASELAGHPTVVVGDVATESVLRAGIEPYLIITDGKTKREMKTDNTLGKAFGDRGVYVDNPAGSLTMSLILNIIEASECWGTLRHRTNLSVDGEVDLAVIPCMMYCKLGTKLVFGIPDRGMGVIDVNTEARRLARQIMSEGKTVVV